MRRARGSLDGAATVRAMCACGREATANGRECPTCFRRRLLSVNNGFTPTRSEGMDSSATTRLDDRLDRYAKARKEGIQPSSTKPRDVADAVAISDAAGEAYRADFGGRGA